MVRSSPPSSAQAPQTLTPEAVGVVTAERPHRVELVGPVRFYVEFYRREGAPSTG